MAFIDDLAALNKLRESTNPEIGQLASILLSAFFAGPSEATVPAVTQPDTIPLALSTTPEAPAHGD